MVRRIQGILLLSLVTPSQLGAERANEVKSLEDLLAVEISTASKYEQTQREAPASVTIVTAEEIDRFGYQTLDDVLESVRGFYTSYDRNYGYVGVRGFSPPTDYNSRIQLQLNGLVLNENFYGSMSTTSELGIGLESVEQIEIVRGPGSALHGSGAMFAVINIITKDGRTVDGGEWTAEGGSWGRARSSLSLGRSFANGVDLMVSGQWAEIDGDDLYFEEFDDPSSNHGVAEGLDRDEYRSGFAALSYKGWQLQAFHTSRTKDIPTAAWETDFNSRSFTTDGWTAIDLRYRAEIGVGRSLRLGAFNTDYFYDGLYPYDGLPFFDLNDSSWSGFNAQLSWDTSAANRLIFGGEYVDNRRVAYRAFDEFDTYVDIDIPYDVVSLYAQDSLQITPDLALTLGLRYDDYSDVGSSFSPRLAFVYHPGERSTLKALYGEAFRRPNHYEVYYEDDLNKSNPDLEPETITTAELIWEQELSRAVYWTVSVFRYQMDHLITAVLLPVEERVQFQNLDEVRANGVELELLWRLPGGFLGSASYSMQETKVAATGERLSNSPQHILRAALSVPVADWLEAAAQVRWESDRRTVYNTELASYLIADLHLSSRRLSERLRVWLRVLNLFDEEYENPGGFEHLQDGIVQEGRNYRIGVKLSF